MTMNNKESLSDLMKRLVEPELSGEQREADPASTASGNRLENLLGMDINLKVLALEVGGGAAIGYVGPTLLIPILGHIIAPFTALAGGIGGGYTYYRTHKREKPGKTYRK